MLGRKGRTRRRAMLAKPYHFLHDHAIPGLTGGFSHILGGAELEVLAAINDLKRVLETKAPVLGEDGYLAEHYPPPSSWTGNSAAWTSTLIRAGWFYLHEFGGPNGCPDEGVERDDDVFKLTRAKFPVLTEDRIELALNHVHVQAYGRPLPDWDGSAP